MKHEIVKLKKNRELKQPTSLVESRYKLTTYEQRMVIAIVSQIDDREEQLPIVTINANDLADFCKFDPSKKIEKAKTIARKLRGRTLEYLKPNGDWYITGWINAAEYNSKDKTIEFHFDERLKPELLSIKSNYLLTPAEPLMKFDRDYSIRLYFILKNKLKFHNFVQNLDFFRDRFQLGKGYKLFANLKKVLEPALAEINEKSDINVQHEYIKEGRAYTKIRFIVESKSDIEKKELVASMSTDKSAEKLSKSISPATESTSLNNISDVTITTESLKTDEKQYTEEQQRDYDRLIKHNVWVPTARKFVATYSHAQIDRNIKGVLKSISNGNIRDVGAVLTNAIFTDIYQDMSEEQDKAKERDKERQDALWEKIQRAEEESEKKKKQEIAEAKKSTQIGKQSKLEKICEKSPEIPDFTFDGSPESIKKVIRIYYENNRRCPENVLRTLEQQGLTWATFQMEHLELFQKFQVQK